MHLRETKIHEAKTDRIERMNAQVTIILGNFNTPFLWIDRLDTRLYISRKLEEHYNQPDITDL